jgi:hypoxanthine-guanine phosphoribosyltransferase
MTFKIPNVKKIWKSAKRECSETWRSRSVINDYSIHVVYDIVSSGKSISTFPRSFKEDTNSQCAVFVTLTVSDAKASSLNSK